MFCQKCGSEISENAAYCPNCGCATNKKTDAENEIDNQSKTIVGFFLGLFLGIIGLIIGLCLYKSGTESSKSFLGGWFFAFIISRGRAHGS